MECERKWDILVILYSPQMSKKYEIRQLHTNLTHYLTKKETYGVVWEHRAKGPEASCWGCSGGLRRWGQLPWESGISSKTWRMSRGQSDHTGRRPHQTEQRACWLSTLGWAWLSWEPAKSSLASSELKRWQARGKRTQKPDCGHPEQSPKGLCIIC